jgi:hypothetical protein
MRAVIVAILSALFLGGCDKKLDLTYKSEPAGAGIYWGNEMRGRTPATFSYNVSSQQIREGGMWILAPTIKWASGAEITPQNFHVDFRINGYSQVFQVQRPEVPGRELDVQFALEVEKLRIMERQAIASERAAKNEEIDSLIKMSNSLLSPGRSASPVCTRNPFTWVVSCN